ncbi:MAG TPA: rhomboid family intramembrane serine protease [Chitinophagaceae bacterium]
MELNTLNFSVTIILIIINVALSIAGFGNQKLMDELIFYPPAISRRHQWYRFITCGFIHADVFHLVFNMYALYMFGEAVEIMFNMYFGDRGTLLYIIMYLTALVVCLLPTYLKNTDNYYYKSLGASGAVAAVVFAFIALRPMAEIGLIIIPGLRFPAFIFAIIYLAVSAYLDRRGGGNINHSAHFWGSVYGIVFLAVAAYFLSDYNVFTEFIDQVSAWFARFR